jgi:hypothetical protein
MSPDHDGILIYWKISDLSDWLYGTITPASGVTINSNYSYFRYNETLHLAEIQLYVTNCPNTSDVTLATLSKNVSGNHQVWSVFADSIESDKTDRILLRDTTLVKIGYKTSGFSHFMASF